MSYLILEAIDSLLDLIMSYLRDSEMAESKARPAKMMNALSRSVFTSSFVYLAMSAFWMNLIFTSHPKMIPNDNSKAHAISVRIRIGSLNEQHLTFTVLYIRKNSSGYEMHS